MVFYKKDSVSDSNFARVIDICKCFGPVASAVKYGRFISVDVVWDNSHLTFSAHSRNLYTAILSLEISIPD
jgi:hypothetical protein